MKPILYAGAVWLGLCPMAVRADDRIASPPADLALAYAHPELAPSANTRALAVAPDGHAAAYVVRMPVEDEAPNAAMFLASGAPTIIAQGAQIRLVDLATRASARICPSQGNDWDPVWSPNGRQLAFYSDRDGETRLWLYERASQACRRVSERPAKSLLWAHEEPRWSPDGAHIYFAAWPATGRGSPAQARVRVAPGGLEMPPGAVRVYRHDPAAQARQAGNRETAAAASFDERCQRISYLAASLAVASIEGDGQSRLLVDADRESAEGQANRHFPSPYQRLSASGRWLTYFDTPCARPGDPLRMAMRLFAVPTAGGTPILIADNLRATVGGDESILNYRWSPVADELVFVRDGALWRVAFGPNGPGEAERLGETLGPLSSALQWYSEDGTMVLVGTNPVQRGPANIPFGYDIDLAMIPSAGGAPVPIAVDRARWQIEGVVARDDRVLLQPHATQFRLLGRDKRTGEAVVLTFDWRTGRTTEAWRGRGRFHDLQAAGIGNLVGIYEDFRTPANLFAYSSDLGNATPLTDVSPGLRAAASSEVELFETVAPQHDGSLRTVRTAVLLPPGTRRGDRLPAIVWFYPGSDLTNNLARFGAPGMGDPAYLLTSRGYAVILADVPIGPGDERGHVIDEIMDSLMPQVHRAADLGYIDISRLAIRGHSFGGFGTLAVIVRTNLFRAAIPSAGAYDLGGSYGEANFVRGTLIDNSDWAENSQPRFGQPVWDDPLRYIENSPYYLADRIRTPVLIIQGTDDFTGSRESGKLFAALRRLNRPVELALYQGGGHTPASWPTAQAVDQMARTLEFLRQHIGEGRPPANGAPSEGRPVSN